MTSRTNGASTSLPSGRLVAEKNGTRYIEGSSWMPISEENREPKDEDGLYSQGGGLLFGLDPSSSSSLNLFHPPPAHVFLLWQTFLNNVDPLVKIIHAPTMQQQMLDATLSSVESMPPNFQALHLSIYGAAITSLTNDECKSQFGKSRNNLMKKYLVGTQQALTRAGLLRTSDLVTLQAFTLSLISMAEMFDSRTLLILAGVAIRLGQRIGLHRDGTYLDISPFDVEMRRRLWWQMWIFEAKVSQQSGAGYNAMVYNWDTKLPLNVNDSDLHPAMNTLPKDKDGATTVIFGKVSCEIANFMRTVHENRERPGYDFDRAVFDFEKLLGKSYLRHCNALVPLEQITSFRARSVICKVRMIANHYRGRQKMTQAEQDTCFANSLQMLEYDNVIHSTKSLRCFLWHVKANFNFEAFIFLINELRGRNGEVADRAWLQVAQAFANHPNMITAKNPLYAAMSDLVLKAWATRVHNSADTPTFISALYAQREGSQMPEPLEALFDMNSMTWDAWDNLLQGATFSIIAEPAVEYLPD